MTVTHIVLEARKFAPLLRGRHELRVGLLTNQSGVDSAGRRTIDVLAHAPDVVLKAVFSPEHGALGTADTTDISNSTDAATGVSIYSVYGSADAQRLAAINGDFDGVSDAAAGLASCIPQAIHPAQDVILPKRCEREAEPAFGDDFACSKRAKHAAFLRSDRRYGTWRAASVCLASRAAGRRSRFFPVNTQALSSRTSPLGFYCIAIACGQRTGVRSQPAGRVTREASINKKAASEHDDRISRTTVPMPQV